MSDYRMFYWESEWAYYRWDGFHMMRRFNSQGSWYHSPYLKDPDQMSGLSRTTKEKAEP